MPICKRDGFENVNSKAAKDEHFQDNEEVFFCEVTKEIFRDYEDYFRHVMVINSTVWQCEATGRENLTYAEALKSERRAKRKMELFKDSLRPPVMLVIEAAKQSSFKSLNAIVSKFLRNRYFLNEEVLASHKTQKLNTWTVIDIIPPGKNPPPHGVYEQTDKIQYKLKRVAEKSVSGDSVITVPFEHIRRQRVDFTLENLSMFIKNHVTRVDGILRPKAEAYQKYIKERNIQFSSVFIGKMPYFQPAKVKKPVQQTTMNKYLVKNQQLQNQQQQLAANKDNNNKERELKAKVDKEKEREAKAKSLREEMERVRREKLERIAELHQQKLDKKAKLMAKIEEECDALLTVTDDLERNDQRLLPVYTPVRTLIPTKHFGDALTICEFMHTFAGYLSGMEVFRPNITFPEITRAFTVHELNGPLTNILLSLLGTVFDLQKEEEDECKPQYLISQKVIQNREPFLSMSEAARAHFYSKRHFCFKINELPIDAYTVSEVLRLHLLSSGARVDDRTERWRVMYRNGYYSTEDPGLDIRINHKHILRALKTQPIYSLEFDDIKLVLDILMAQILSYSSPINLVEERCEEMAKARLELRALNTAENRRALTVAAQKRLLTNEYNQQCMKNDVIGDAAKKAVLEEKLNKKLEELQAQSDRERKKYESQVEDRNAALFNFLVCLGSDRAYRKYYILESIPGIFVEHSPDSMDSCLANPPRNAASANRVHNRDLPKTRKELRAYLLKLNSDEEKKAKSNGIVKQMVPESLEDKENQENLVNELETAPTSSSTADDGDVQMATVTTRASTNGSVVKKEESTTSTTELTQYELFMCTGDPSNCIVHDPNNKDRQRWAYIYKKEDVDSLIDSLNPMGVRELKLREQLTTLRTLIDNHIKKCPLDMLSVDSTNIKKFKAQMMGETQKRSTRNNRVASAENDIATEMIYTLTEQILEFESDIYTGDLGRLKVKNMEKWREDVLNGTYDPQVKLQWGPTQIYKSTTTPASAATGGATTNGDGEATDEESDDEAMDDYQDGYVEFAGKPYRDPGEDLGDVEETPAIKREGVEGQLEIKKEMKDDPEETLQKVRNFASALLQVEQAIERRFIKEPFGAPIQKKEVKDKEMLERKMKIGSNRLKQWELSLMESTSYSQVLLHLNVLHDCIIWSRSTNKSSCQVCRRVTDPDKMLLCDECNGGTHMFCMKPKMKTIPEGNWYCLRCVRTMGLSNNAGESKKKTTEKRKRQFIVEEEAVEQVNNGGESDDDEASSNHSDVRRASNARGRKLKANEIEEAMNEQADDDYDSDCNGAAVADDDDVEADSSNRADNDEEMNGGEDDDDDESAHEEDDDICNVCSYEGSDLMCTKCKDSFHLECINLKRPPRYNFICNKCKSKDDSRKQKAKPQYDNSDDDDDDSEEAPPVKRSRQSRTSLRNSLPNGDSSEQTSTSKSSSSRRSHRRTADNLPLNTASMYELLADIMKHEKAWPFVRPVSQSEVPDYYEIIKTPMDLSKIKSKLNMGEYNLNEQLLNDLQLVFSNCDQYNMESNEVYKAGAALEKYVMKRCSELNLNFKPSDMQS